HAEPESDQGIETDVLAPSGFHQGLGNVYLLKFSGEPRYVLRHALDGLFPPAPQRLQSMLVDIGRAFDVDMPRIDGYDHPRSSVSEGSNAQRFDLRAKQLSHDGGGPPLPLVSPASQVGNVGPIDGHGKGQLRERKLRREVSFGEEIRPQVLLYRAPLHDGG